MVNIIGYASRMSSFLPATSIPRGRNRGLRYKSRKRAESVRDAGHVIL